MDNEAVSKIEITKEWGLERKWWIFLAVGVGTFMSALDASLVKTGVPVVNVCGGSFWQQRHVADVVTYVRLACHPDDSEAFQRVYNIASASFVHPWGARKGEYCHHRYLGKKSLGKSVFLEACGCSYLRVQEAVKAVYNFQPGVEDLTGFVNCLQAHIPEGAAANCFDLRVYPVHIVSWCSRRTASAKSSALPHWYSRQDGPQL